MSDPQERSCEQRKADAARTQEREGHGLVPNAPTGQEQGQQRELKEALHDVEEKQGDWGKDR